MNDERIKSIIDKIFEDFIHNDDSHVIEALEKAYKLGYLDGQADAGKKESKNDRI